jgi:hypothetical protein
VAGFVSKANLNENQLWRSPRGEMGAANHSFSKSVKVPRTWWAETSHRWLPGGLIAGGSGIVSTAATKRIRQIKQTAHLNFKASSKHKRPLS